MVNFTHAAFNPEINYQGKLTTPLGVSVPDGDYHMRFWLLEDDSIATTSAIWTEVRTGGDVVEVKNGLFSVMLGEVTPLTGIDFNQPLYLGVEIGGDGGSPEWDGEMSPRKILGAVPAAFVSQTALSADTFAGLATSSFLRADQAGTLSATSSGTLLSLIQNGGGDILNLFSGSNPVLAVSGTNLDLGSSLGIAWNGVRYLYASTTNNSIAFGQSAGHSNISSMNVFLGFQAGINASSSGAHNNNFIGRLAGADASGGGHSNNLIGFGAGRYNTGSQNNIFGTSAGLNNASDFNNIFGYFAGLNNIGEDNILIGSQAGRDNIGSTNIAIGTSAGSNNSGNNNSFFGASAGRNNTGDLNEMIGYETGFNLQATSSTIVGSQAFRGNSAFSAVNNVALGYRAGYNATTGADNNILLGYRAADNLTTGANNIVIGYDVDLQSASQSNTLNIGNLLFGTGIDGTGTTLSSGNIGIGTSTPSHKLTVAGDTNLTGALRFSGDAGLSGMILQSTGSGAEWVATSSLASIVASSTVRGMLAATGGALSYDMGTGIFSLVASASTSDGYLSATDWQTFNSKISSRWSAVGDDISYLLGKVGIGTSTPNAMLSVLNTSADAQLVVAYDATRQTALKTDALGNFTITPTGSDVSLLDQNLFVCAGGACPAGSPAGVGNLIVESRVGIGTSTPTSALTIIGDMTLANIGASIFFGGTSSTTAAGFRENGGMMQVRHENGSWRDLSWQDTAPATFSFDPIADAATSSVATSTFVIPTGYQGAIPIALHSTNGTAEVEINGVWSAVGGAIAPGQALRLRMQTPENPWEIVSTTIYAGETAAVWEVATDWTCGDDQVKDADGNSYNTLEIGGQCWLAENLRVGTTTLGANNMSDNGIVERYCYSDNSTNCLTDGGLYQWNEAMQYTETEGAQGICMPGWHIPTDYEWYVLENYLDPTVNDPGFIGERGIDIGTKLKVGGSSGMEMKLGGYRTNTATFLNRFTHGNWWSSSENSGSSAWYRYLFGVSSVSNRYSISQVYGMSVRCLKDI